MRPLRTLRGFTMLELIVVIVILGILAAIAIPTFRGVITRSQDASAETSLTSFAREVQALAAFRGDGSLRAEDFTSAATDFSQMTEAPGTTAAAVSLTTGEAERTGSAVKVSYSISSKRGGAGLAAISPSGTCIGVYLTATSVQVVRMPDVEYACNGATARNEVAPDAAEAGVPLTSSLAGVVRTMQGPLEGALVSVYLPDRTYLKTARTGADGRYQVSGLAAGEYKVHIKPNKPGYPATWYGLTTFDTSTGVPVTGAGTLDVNLEGPASFAGVASTPDGPLAGAIVSVYAPELVDGKTKFLKSATTSADGSYRIAGLDVGEYKLIIKSNNNSYSSYWYGGYSFDKATRVKADGGTSLNLPIERTYAVSGNLTVNGAPQAGVRVSAYTADTREWMITATTDANGNYNLVGLPVGTYKLHLNGSDVKLISRWYGGTAFETATRYSVSANTTVPVVFIP